MIDEKQADAPATEDVADDKVKTEEQLWNDASDQGAIESTSDDADVDSHEDAAPEGDDAGTADDAVQEDEAPDAGDEPDKQGQKDTEKRLKGQISGQTRKISELQKEIKAYQAHKSDETRTSADLDSLTEEYPDIVGPLLKRQQEMQADMANMSDQLSRFTELQRAQGEAHETSERDSLDQAHPGWYKFLTDNGDDFSTWADDQPAATRSIVRDNTDSINDAEGLSTVLASFKAHLAGPDSEESAPSGADLKRGNSSRRERQLDGARTIPSRGSQTATSKPQPGEQDEDAIWNHVTR